MKYLIKNLLKATGLFLICLSFIGCSSDDKDDDGTIVLDTDEITTGLTAGTWQVSNFVDAGVDETAGYADFTFTFNADGSIGATNMSSSASGAWSLTSTGDNDVELMLFFSAPELLAELSESWDVVTFNGGSIELEDDAGMESEETLSFTKN